MLVWLADLLTRRAYWIAMLTACAVGVAAVVTGSSVSLENWLDQRASAFTQKASSGEVIIVEIDAKSLAQVQAWPWPRSTHGRLVDRLRDADSPSRLSAPEPVHQQQREGQAGRDGCEAWLWQIEDGGADHQGRGQQVGVPIASAISP